MKCAGNTLKRRRLRDIAFRAVGSSLLALGSAGCFGVTSGETALLDDDASAKCSAPADAERMADQVLQLVNLERSEAGLAPLVSNDRLDSLAADYACAMIEDDFFGHVDPLDGSGPGERAARGRYAFFAVGENLAAGQESAADVMDVWMRSPAHREVILDARWSQVGIAVRDGGRHGIYWVQEFGDPARFPEAAP